MHNSAPEARNAVAQPAAIECSLAIPTISPFLPFNRRFSGNMFHSIVTYVPGAGPSDLVIFGGLIFSPDMPDSHCAHAGHQLPSFRVAAVNQSSGVSALCASPVV